MRSKLANLLERRWFLGVRVTNTNYFVDIFQAKLAVFLLNGVQRKDLNKIVGVISLCRGGYSNKPMGIFCL